MRPDFSCIKILDDGNKNLQGAQKFLSETDIVPKKRLIIQALDNDLSSKKNQFEILDELTSLVNQCRNKFPGIQVKVVEPLARSVSFHHDRWYNQKANFIVSKFKDVVGLENTISCPKVLKNANTNFFIKETKGLIYLNYHGYELLNDAYQKSMLDNTPDHNPHGLSRMHDSVHGRFHENVRDSHVMKKIFKGLLSTVLIVPLEIHLMTKKY